jgi:ADP-ribose pyrophosphatase YjhB (NUDIX family)
MTSSTSEKSKPVTRKSRSSIRVAAGVALVERGRILLIPHHDKDNQIRAWYMPGGKVEFGERLREAAVREVLEETGFEVEIGELIDVRESIKSDYHGIRLTFNGRITGGELRPDLSRHDPPKRIAKANWFTPAELEGVTVVPSVAVRKALGLEEISLIEPWLETL